MSMEDVWNDNHTRKPTYSKKNLFQCHFVNQKSHITGLELNPGLRSERLVPLAFQNTDDQDMEKLILYVMLMFCTGFRINERSTFLIRRLIRILYLQAKRAKYGTRIEF